MIKITKVEIQKRDKNRASIFINDEFAFGVEVNDIIKYNIQKGNIYSEKEYNELLNKLQYEKAKTDALRYISYSPRSIKQTREKLYSLDYADSIIESIIEYLKEHNYLNNEEYAEIYIRNSILNKRHGRNKIMYQLNNFGVSDDIIEPILEDYKEEEYKQAKRLFLKRTKGKVVKDYKEKAKIMRYLQNRGYNYMMINEIIHEPL